MTNYKVDKEKVIFADESFVISGVCFYVHNTLGRFGKEKQYCDLTESRFKELEVEYQREIPAGNTGNRADFIVFNKILFEIKAKPFLTQVDYAQVQRYLQIFDLELGLIVNFWSRSAQPHRVLRQKNNILNSKIRSNSQIRLNS